MATKTNIHYSIHISNLESLTRQFENIGASLQLERPDERLLKRESNYHHVDVQQGKRGERFIISCIPSKFRLQVLQADTQDRHLLLMMQNTKSGEIHKYLCGHDERQWFAAAIPEEARAKSIREAKEALLPPEAEQALSSREVRKKKQLSRSNPPYIRQGEWFFISEEPERTGDEPIHRNEPLQRSGSAKPHIAEEVIRTGGETVFINALHAPEGLTEEEFERFKREHNEESGRGWNRRFRRRIRGALVYARGKVRHPDHATVELKGWHRVVPNTEDQAEARRHLVFLD